MEGGYPSDLSPAPDAGPGECLGLSPETSHPEVQPHSPRWRILAVAMIGLGVLLGRNVARRRAIAV